MKKSILAMGLMGSLALAGTTAPAFADGEEAASSGFSGYVTLTSDYRFRGISQSDNSAALQAAINYTHASGIFFEVWASNVDFSEFTDSDAAIEVDLTAGYATALTDLTDFSIKAVYYLYPDYDAVPGDPDDINYWEFIAGLSRKFGSTTGTLEVAWTPEYAGDSGQAWAVTGGLEFPLMDKLWFFDGLTGSGHFGVQAYDDADPLDPIADYTFWDLGLSTSYGGITLDARYVDTDLDVQECGVDPCEGGMMFSATFEWGG
jgi:uncharacterized protein (TIGR02001 family)